MYCPSVKVDDPEYVCLYCRKNYTTKKLHLRATQHHLFQVVDDKESNEDADDAADDINNIEDGLCLIPSMTNFWNLCWILLMNRI